MQHYIGYRADTQHHGNQTSIAVVIVTYASGQVLRLCLDALRKQSRPPDMIVIVDNASVDPAYLNEIEDDPSLLIVRNSTNEGFCKANNSGFNLARHCTYVLFLNPDAFLHPDFLEKAEAWMELEDNKQTGLLTGMLLRFDLATESATDIIDSTGIFQTWYGKWYDRGQGEASNVKSIQWESEDIPASCGALMFCRSAALQTVIKPGADAVFDPTFFMYKEDIDLSLRLRRRGWRLSYVPSLVCFHCRGWKNRELMSPRAKFLSARNELIICTRNFGKGAIFTLLKLAYLPIEALMLRARRRLAREGAGK